MGSFDREDFEALAVSADRAYPRRAMRLVCESEATHRVFVPEGGGEALIAFMSFALSRGFGAAHPLIALADRLHEVHGVRLGPLTNFYDARIEDAEDAEKRELTWQDAEELAETLGALVKAVGLDGQCAALMRRGGAATLACEANALLTHLRAEPPGARVRLGYEL
jgi:hypothetical protein